MHTSRTAIAAAALWIYGSALHHVINFGPTIFGESYGGHYQFLTILGLTISLAQAAVALVGELSGLFVLQWLGNKLLQLSAPLEVLISLLYWGIRFIDPNLVMDPRVAPIESSLDRKLHLWPAVLQSLAAILIPVADWRAGVAAPAVAFGGLAAGYWWWVHQTFDNNGFWPYPLLGVLSAEQRGLLFGGAGLLVFLSFKGLQQVQKGFRRGQ